MKTCYNNYCPFNGEKPCECGCADMCDRFTGAPVVVYTSDHTERAERSYSSATDCIHADKEEC